jgi:hypothetical protein
MSGFKVQAGQMTAYDSSAGTSGPEIEESAPKPLRRGTSEIYIKVYVDLFTHNRPKIVGRFHSGWLSVLGAVGNRLSLTGEDKGLTLG